MILNVYTLILGKNGFYFWNKYVYIRIYKHIVKGLTKCPI